MDTVEADWGRLVSEAEFQTAQARLVTDSEFLKRAQVENDSAFGPGLSAGERRRLTALASQKGIVVTARLIRSFRLGKILSLLPLSCTLLGDDYLAREAKAFWNVNPPDSFYPLGEALAFCRYLKESRISKEVAYLKEVVEYEEAMLELSAAKATGEELSRVVRFSHNPAVLLCSLRAGRPPRDVPEMPCDVVAKLDDQGVISWCHG